MWCIDLVMLSIEIIAEKVTTVFGRALRRKVRSGLLLLTTRPFEDID
jgi:hypothetical protein